MFDIIIIGGGINGTGIARDAAGRGLSVLLVEKGDLAQATSSASTKLIHGGLRYLEQYNFKLVRESLKERTRLLKTAPHLVRPLEFILPHDPSLRPRWLIRLGLYLYDLLGNTTLFAPSKGLNLQKHNAGKPLNPGYNYGFSYTDCQTDDARLTLLCARDAQEKGADIRPRTQCIKLSPNDDKKSWKLSLHDKASDRRYDVYARCVVNAAGPWAATLLEENGLSYPDTPKIRHSKGSHIVVPKLYESAHAYILQQPDGRIVFAIPYETNFTLIGTTDVEYRASLDHIEIDDSETDYLCRAATNSFKKPVTKDRILWSYSGVRTLLDNGNTDKSLAQVTRDYRLDLETRHGPPLLNVFGGKLTTFRRLSEKATDTICKTLHNNAKPWTQDALLPGGDIPGGDFEKFAQRQQDTRPFINHALLRRYARAYGTRMETVLKDAKTEEDLGQNFGENIYEAELRYAVREEWVRTAEDFLWRRSKLGLHISAQTRQNIEDAIAEYIKDEDHE